jgi:hypothetical protein
MDMAAPNYRKIRPALIVVMKLIEVKGGHIWDRDIVRFKGARAYWPEFAFEMHQKTRRSLDGNVFIDST